MTSPELCHWCERPGTVRETVTYPDRVTTYMACDGCRTPFPAKTKTDRPAFVLGAFGLLERFPTDA